MDKVLILLLEYRVFAGLTDIDVANIKSAIRIGAAWWNKRLIYYEPLMSWYTYEYLVSNGFIKGLLYKYREEYSTTITFTTMTNTSPSLHMTTPTVSITYTTTLMITISSESTTISYSESPIMSNLTTPYTRKTPYTTPPTTMQPCQPVDLYTKEYENTIISIIVASTIAVISYIILHKKRVYSTIYSIFNWFYRNSYSFLPLHFHLLRIFPTFLKF